MCFFTFLDARRWGCAPVQMVAPSQIGGGACHLKAQLTVLQKHKKTQNTNTSIHKYTNTRIQDFADTQILRWLENLRLAAGCHLNQARVTALQKYTKMLEYQNTKLQNYKNTRIHRWLLHLRLVGGCVIRNTYSNFLASLTSFIIR